MSNESNWISVDERLPERACLAYYKNSPKSKGTIIKAFYAQKFEVEQNEEYSDCLHEYCKEKDAYFLPEGWYECIENWDEYSSITISNVVMTHWMPLPKPPIGT